LTLAALRVWPGDTLTEFKALVQHFDDAGIEGLRGPNNPATARSVTVFIGKDGESDPTAPFPE
jgi:hypothetical protein